MGKVNRFLNGLPRGYHPHIHLPLPSQPNTSYEARTEVDHPPIDSGHVRVRVEHHLLIALC